MKLQNLHHLAFLVSKCEQTRALTSKTEVWDFGISYFTESSINVMEQFLFIYLF